MLQIIITNRKIKLNKNINDISIEDFEGLHFVLIELVDKNQQIQNHYLDNKLYETY